MLDLNFSPFPDLKTERLFLRRVSVDDAHEIMELRGNAETMKYIPRPLAKTIEDAMAHITMIDDKINSNEGINWAITINGNPKLIGIIGHYKIQKENFRAEIGYMLLPEFHNRGIISEAIHEVVNYGFESMKLHSIEAIIDPRNFASEKVLQKNSFIKEAHIIENGFYDGVFIDTVIYSLLKRNFKN